MSGSGRAGNGRGNNRKRLFRRREKENDGWQENYSSENDPPNNGDRSRGDGPQKGPPASFDRRPGNRGPQNPSPRQPLQPSGRGYNNRGRGSDDNQGRQNRSFSRRNNENPRGEKAPFVERPKWVAPAVNNDPLPVPDCPWCGKPIRDISSAIADKDTGMPVHFDCVAARIAGAENLEKGDVVTYIGAGRFGIVSFGRAENHDFKIKKIIEWENKDNRAGWRSEISDHYSVT